MEVSRSFSLDGAAVFHILAWFTLVRRACHAGGSGFLREDLLRFDTSATRVRKGVRITLGMTRSVSVGAAITGAVVVGEKNRLGRSRCERLRDSRECLRVGRHCDNFGRTLRRACMASCKSFEEMPDVQGIFSVTIAHLCAQWHCVFAEVSLEFVRGEVRRGSVGCRSMNVVLGAVGERRVPDAAARCECFNSESLENGDIREAPRNDARV